MTDGDIGAAVNALRRIMRTLRLAAGATQAEAGISAAQLYVLRQLEDGVVLSINELASRTLTDRTSVSAVVDRLVARGLLERTASASDRRRAEVRLTDAGRRLLANAPPAPTTLLVNALERMTEAELHALAHALGRLERALGVESQPPAMFFEEDADGVADGTRGSG